MTSSFEQARAAVAGLLAPRSIAIVGSSPSGGYGGSAHLNLQRFGYTGRLYAINPKYAEVFGNPSFGRLADLPEVVDCVVVGVAAGSAVDVVAEAADLGIHRVVLLASGFGESDEEGQRLQRRLVEIAAEAGISLCGPNCLGFINLVDRTVPFAGGIPGELPAGKLAIVSQSGGMSSELTCAFAARSVGLSYVVSSGNGAVTSIEDYLAFLAEAPDVGAIAMVVEGFRKPRLLMEALERAAVAGKRVVALKLGRSEQGARQVASHTGALAGDDRIVDAVLERFGAARVANLDDLVETAVCFAIARPPSGRKIAIVTGSGGRASLSADLAAAAGLELASCSPQTAARLESLLPPFATVSNPLDVTGPVYQQDENYLGALTALAEDPDVGLLAVYQAGAKSAGPSAKHQGRNLRLGGLVAAAADAVDTPVVAFTTSAVADMDLALARLLHERAVPFLQGGDRAMAAIARLRDCARAPAAVHLPPADAAVPKDLVERLRREGALSEVSSKALLRACGVPVSRGELVSSADQAVEAAGRLGYPVAIKAVSAQVAHKSKLGLVALGIHSPDALTAACSRLAERMASTNEPFEGVLVEDMAEPGIEVLLGARGSDFGPAILFGAGGVLTEVAQDTAITLGPLDRALAEQLVSRTRIGQLLLEQANAGFDALLDAMVRFSQLAQALAPAFREIDVNPLIVTPSAAIAVDALIR